MRRCAVGQGRRCQSLFRTRRRAYADLFTDAAAQEARSAADGDIAHGPGTGPQAEAEAEAATGAVGKASRPERRPLPISPVMDPAYQAAKQKHELPKAPRPKDPTAFQRQLARCPYALALATPVRMCHLTQSRLPSFFLQDFSVVAHPDTHQPWYMPRSLTSPHSPHSTPPAAAPRPDVAARGSAVGGKAWVLARHALLRGTVARGSGLPAPPARRLMRQRQLTWRAWPKKVHWRPDIDDFVLELMRRRVVEGLEYLCGRQRGYLVATAGWPDAMTKKKQVGAFLWAGRDGAEAEMGRPGAAAAAPEPGEFATVDVREGKRRLPVYNLPALLGPAHVRALRTKMPKIFDAAVVVLKDKRPTIDVRLRLWKLQGFHAQYEQIKALHAPAAAAAAEQTS